jgi:hypothetical protein
MNQIDLVLNEAVTRGPWLQLMVLVCLYKFKQQPKQSTCQQQQACRQVLGFQRQQMKADIRRNNLAEWKWNLLGFSLSPFGFSAPT